MYFLQIILNEFMITSTEKVPYFSIIIIFVCNVEAKRLLSTKFEKN